MTVLLGSLFVLLRRNGHEVVCGMACHPIVCACLFVSDSSGVCVVDSRCCLKEDSTASCFWRVLFGIAK